MKRSRIVIVPVVTSLALSMLACAVANPLGSLAGGGDTAVTELWSDVPRMDGMEPSGIDNIPLPIKLVLNTILGNLGRLNPEGGDQSTGSIDWIGFTTSKTADDLVGFYSSERMAANGWEAPESEPCLNSGGGEMPLAGTFCVFSKDNQQTMLAIIATPDTADSSRLSVFFLRLGKVVK